MNSLSPSSFADDMHAALRGQPKSISPKYFYDAQGSALFDQICDLPEYYPTRTETALLTDHAQEIATCMGPEVELLEFGAGSLRKVRLLLDALQRPARYLPMDISGEHLDQAVAQMRMVLPHVDVQALVADYTADLSLPALAPGARRRVGFFPGSTIGNFAPAEALAFLRRCATWLRGGGLLLGADLIKAPEVLHAAYNDSQGVTARFNRNLLVRANHELGTDFELAQFAHSAFYNAPMARIEMHLMSLCKQQVHLGPQTYSFDAGETLHTENSHKFSLDSLAHLAHNAGFVPGQVWTDSRQQFALMWLNAPE